MTDYTLKDLIKINNGRDYRHLSVGNIPVIGSGGVMCYVNEFLYDGEAILLPRKGTLDNIMYVTDKFWTVDTMYWATVNPSLVDARYLYLYLTQLDLSNLDTGSTLPSMTNDTYNMVPVKLPDLNTQKEIADRIFAIREKIRNNNAICSNLEAMAKLLYDYWFVQFDFPDENGKPYKSSGGKMVWNDDLKREIPAGWEVKTVSDLAAFKAESILPIKNVKYNHYSIPSFDDSNTPYCEYGEEIASNKYVVPNYCVLVSKLNPQFKRIWLILEPGENAICSTEFLPFTTDSKSIFYLYELLNSDLYSIHLKQKASSSTGSRKRIDPDNCLSFQTAYNKDVVELFNNMIAPLIKQINLIPFENQQLTSLRDFLLPMLMNGQVKIQEEGADA